MRDKNQRQQTAPKISVNLRLQIDNLTYALDGHPRQMEAPPFIAQDRTMVPIRLVAEALGAEVEWVDATRTAMCAVSV